MAQAKCFNMYKDYVTIEITLIILVILVAVYLIYNQNRNLKIKLSNNKERFTKHIPEVPTVTMYFTNWCGHSRRMLPVYNTARAKYLGKVDFFKHDCDDANGGGKTQCISNKIKFLPTILYRKTKDSEPVLYKGGPDITVLSNFIDQQLPKSN